MSRRSDGKYSNRKKVSGLAVSNLTNSQNPSNKIIASQVVPISL